MTKTLYTKGRIFHYNGKDLHTQYGYIKASSIDKAKSGDILESNTHTKFTVLETLFYDLLKKIKRGPQIIPLKDIGSIITECGLGKDSVVLDAGTGSGALACLLAHICKKVYTYEVREDFFNIAEKNFEKLELKNIVNKKKDIYEGIAEKELDAIIFDLPEAWKASEHALNALKFGGFLVSYSPTIPQVGDFVNSLSKGLEHIKTIEILEREWEVKGRKIRPKSQSIGHSGFLSFTRKI